MGCTRHGLMNPTTHIPKHNSVHRTHTRFLENTNLALILWVCLPNK